MRFRWQWSVVSQPERDKGDRFQLVPVPDQPSHLYFIPFLLTTTKPEIIET
jgi:hypothetical protein